jgi:DNA-binding NtrC family response regulator
MARKGVFALLVHDSPSPLESLKADLNNLSVKTWNAKSLDEAARLLDQTHPELVFTDTQLADGTWSEVISLAEQAGAPANVIVVGSHVDIKVYISAMESGAFDFIVPPLEPESLAHVVGVAIDNVRRRREAEAAKQVG